MAPPGGGTDGSAVRRLRVLRSALEPPTRPHSPLPTQCHGESEGISVLEPPAPGDQEQTAAIVAAFKRDGIVCIPGVFSDTECGALRGRIDRLFDQRPPADPDSLTPVTAAEKRTPIGSYVIPKCYLADRVLARLFAHPVIFSLMEAILGPDMQQCGEFPTASSSAAVQPHAGSLLQAITACARPRAPTVPSSGTSTLPSGSPCRPRSRSTTPASVRAHCSLSEA